MPCFSIHLAVAKKYLELHPEENLSKFIEGTIAPDISEDKNASHYGENYITTNAMLYMKKKTNLVKFLESNKIDNSFQRGYFLHLICDYKFFDYYIDSSILKTKSLDEVVKLGFLDYDRISQELLEEFDLVSLDLPKKILDMMNRSDGKKLEFLDKSHVYNFIDEMSQVDLNLFEINLKNSSK